MVRFTTRRRRMPLDGRTTGTLVLHATKSEDGNDKDGDKHGDPVSVSFEKQSNNSNATTTTTTTTRSTVYEDLKKLEKAIILEEPEVQLRQALLKERVDYIDQHSKRPVVLDAVRYIVMPLTYALLLNIVLVSTTGRLSSLRTLARAGTHVLDLHFLLCVVWCPILFNGWKRWYQPQPAPVPFNLDGEQLDIFKKFIPIEVAFEGWDDPATSCTDYVLFLSEYWTSAVNGLAWIQLLKWMMTRLVAIIGGGGGGTMGTTIATALSSSWLVLFLSCTQVVTRMGAFAAVYQFPIKYYELERSTLTRPVGFFPYLMWKMVRVMAVVAPLGFISDFAQVLSQLSTPSVYALYGSIAVMMYGTWTRMQEISSKDPLKYHTLKPSTAITKNCYRVCYGVLWRKQLRRLLVGVTSIQKKRFGGRFLLERFFWGSLGIGYLVCLPLLGPIAHLKAISQNFQIEYSNNLPAILTQKMYNQIHREDPARCNDRRWRYSLCWREPEKLKTVKGRLWSHIPYWLLLKGSEADKHEVERRAAIEKHFKKFTLLERLKSEMNDTSISKEERLIRDNPDTWKSRASSFLAERHEKEFETKQITDPLGVVVYKAFGVGIGYNFDHGSELEEGQEPSTRRLQARAAKSAVRRYNELVEKEQQIQQLNETLMSTNNKEDHDRRIRQMKKKVDQELHYIGNRLYELIPQGPGNSSEFGHVNTALFKQKPKAAYRKVSSHEYQKIVEENPFDYEYDDTSVEGRLLNSIKSYNVTINSSSSSSEIQNGDDDNNTSLTENDDTDDDNDGLLDIFHC